MSTRITPILLLLVASTSLIAQSADGDAKLSLRDRNFLRDFGPDFPVGEDPDPGLEVEVRLRRSPEDAWAIRKATDELQLDNERMVNRVAERHYFDGFDRMQKEMLAPLDQVEKSLEDHEAMLIVLPAKSAAARAAIKWGRTYIERERVMLEVYRTSRADYRDRVLSDPLNGMEAAKFFQRVIFRKQNISRDIPRTYQRLDSRRQGGGRGNSWSIDRNQEDCLRTRLVVTFETGRAANAVDRTAGTSTRKVPRGSEAICRIVR